MGAEYRIALLRGINVGGHNKIPMADLRALCAEQGWTDVATYIQSGNVLFKAPHSNAAVQSRLTDGIADRFGFRVPVIVRNASDWPGFLAANPFPEASAREPNRVMLALSAKPLAADAGVRMMESATGDERVVQAGGALWIHYAAGSARSRLTPALLDRCAGAPVTTRNWRTAVKLGEMLATT